MGDVVKLPGREKLFRQMGLVNHSVGIHRTTHTPGEGRQAQFVADCSCGWGSRDGDKEWAQRQALWHAKEAKRG